MNTTLTKGDSFLGASLHYSMNQQLFFLSRCLLAACLLLWQFDARAQTLQPLYAANSNVTATVVSGNTLYIGGSFTELGNPAPYGTALDNGAGTAPLNKTLLNAAVTAVAPDGSGGWYIGGSFTVVNGVTRNRLAHIFNDGTLDASWDPNASGTVRAIVVSGSTVYVGGDFNGANSINGNLTRNRIAAIDATAGTATSWDPNASGTVRAIVLSGSTVYIGGDFSGANSINGNLTRNRLAAIDSTTGTATSWDPNAGGTVFAIAVSGSTVYIGGGFNGANSINGNLTRNRIAAIDAITGTATSWDPNANGTVNAVAVSGSTVYIGGFFSGATAINGNLTRNRIAAIDATSGTATSWNPNANSAVNAIAVSGSTVYIGGQFNGATAINGNLTRNRLAAIDATTGTATSWDPNANGTVSAIAVQGNEVYAGGTFTLINVVTRNRIAAIDLTTGRPTSWNPNAGATVFAIAVSGSTVYIGGAFNGANSINGNLTRNRIAAIDAITGTATSWDPNTNSTVNAIAVSGSTVYIGGVFSGANSINGNLTRNHIAAIDATTGTATSWDPNASGTVRAIVVSGSTVYVGGDFNGATAINGNLTRNYIAAIDSTTGTATSWDPNANSTVNAIAISGSTVYIGGLFNGATALNGNLTRNCIAAVDATTGTATSWNPNATNVARAIVVSGSTVYIGGTFNGTNAINGNLTRNYIAAIDSTTGTATSWNPNANGTVNAIAVSGSTVYIGGNYTMISSERRPSLAAVSGASTYNWTGAVSNDYNTAGNWNPSGVPAATDNVTIPSGTTNPPNLNNTTFTVSEFIQNAGQTLSLGTGNMNVTGSFTNNGLVSGSGRVILNGAAPQTISGSGTIGNMELNNGTGATIGATAADSLKISGLLTLTSGTLTTNNKLKLKSTASNQAAMVGPIPVSGAAISGNVIHERYLSAPGNGSGGRSWRLLTSPLANNATDNSIFYHWQNNGVNDGTGIDLFSPTGTGTTGNGLTQGGAAPSIRGYNAITNAYVNVTNTKTTMLFDGTRNNTFLAFVSGHYGSGNITGGSGITNADAAGSLVTGTQTYNFTPPNATNIYYLMGNPYACPIDFDDVYNNAGTQNINRMFWVVDPNLSNVGAYVTVTYTGGTYVTSAGNQNQYIQTGQGFFVEGNSVGNQSAVVIEEDDKETSAAQTPMFRTNGGSLETFRIKLFKNINNVSTLLDGTVVAGHQNTSNAIDGEDGVKFGNFNENISIWKGNNIRLAIEGRLLLDNNDTVSMALSNMQQTAYQLEFEPGNMNVPGLSATLIDNFANTTTPISLTANTTYNFTITSSSASTGNNRFKVVFNNTTPLSVQFVNVRAEKKESAVQVNWAVNDQQGIKTYEVERSSDGKEFKKIASLNAAAKADYSFTDQAPFSGNNYYRIKAIARSSNGVYSNIVRVNLNQINASLSSYPNPAKGSNLQISISNLIEGNYFISLYNAVGQKAEVKQISFEGGSTMINMNIDHLDPGIYIMQLVNEQGETIAEQKIVRQ